MITIQKVTHYKGRSFRVKKAILDLTTKNKPVYQYLQNLLDWPQREIKGLEGTFCSMEKNMVHPARKWMKNRPRQVRLSGKNWGLAGMELTQKRL